MNPPFEIIKQGEAQLEWGLKPDGRFWVRVVCKLCNNPGSLAVGGRTHGARVRNKAIAEVLGYTYIKYREQRVSITCRRGWTVGKTAITYIPDVCTQCKTSFTLACQNFERNAGRPSRTPTDLPTVTEYYYRWLANVNKTMIKRLMKEAK